MKEFYKSNYKGYARGHKGGQEVPVSSLGKGESARGVQGEKGGCNRVQKYTKRDTRNQKRDALRHKGVDGVQE